MIVSGMVESLFVVERLRNRKNLIEKSVRNQLAEMIGMVGRSVRTQLVGIV